MPDESPLDILILRLEGPLMSFGGVAVDEQRPTDPMPGLSMLTGLLANALGFDHSERDRLEDLQGRLRFASRCDRPGDVMRDFQTVDLGQSFLQSGWTTRGHIEGRGGGTKSSTHIRLRDYLADAVYTVAVTVEPSEGASELTGDALEAALRKPARPLFLGRKACLPSRRLFESRVRASSPLAALREVPPAPRASAKSAAGGLPPWLALDAPERLTLWWSEGEPVPDGVEVHRRIPVWDRRDWWTQTHTGRRWIVEGSMAMPSADQTTDEPPPLAAELAAASRLADEVPPPAGAGDADG